VAFFLSEKLQNVMPVTEVLALFWQQMQRPGTRMRFPGRWPWKRN
jgi:hypothetical protein